MGVKKLGQKLFDFGNSNFSSGVIGYAENVSAFKKMKKKNVFATNLLCNECIELITFSPLYPHSRYLGTAEIPVVPRLSAITFVYPS